MTARTSDVPTSNPHLTKVRRWLALHRRMVSGALTFCSVLFALQVLADQPAPSPDTTSGVVAASTAAGQLQYPIRLGDEAIATLLTPGDVVDVLGSPPHGSAAIVASNLLVTEVPTGAGGMVSAVSDDTDGLVVVAATPEEALALATAASRGPLTVMVHP